MSQSLSNVYVHLVFSTKNREPVLYTPIKEELFSYVGIACRQMECFPLIVGGYTDHLHILCMLSKKVTIVKLVEVVKSSSSKWIKSKGSEYQGFYWQIGYGAFSVSPTQVDLVRGYIENQEVHHKEKSYQDEFRGFLKKYKVAYDERYVWD